LLAERYVSALASAITPTALVTATDDFHLTGMLRSAPAFPIVRKPHPQDIASWARRVARDSWKLAVRVAAAPVVIDGTVAPSDHRAQAPRPRGPAEPLTTRRGADRFERHLPRRVAPARVADSPTLPPERSRGPVGRNSFRTMGEERPGADRYPALDGLRAFAIGEVLWHHCGPCGRFFDRGLGVNAFFAISGFLITTLLLREQARTGAISIARFYVRRALRIMPLYFAVLACYVVLVSMFEHDPRRRGEFFSNLPFLATFTANWALDQRMVDSAVMGFAWSLSTQVQVYLVWPWIVCWGRRRPTVVSLILAFVVVVNAWWLPLTAADGIGLGCLAAYLLRTPRGAQVLRRIAGASWSAPAALAVVLSPLAWPSLPVVTTIVALAWFVVACALRPGILAPLLAWRPVRWVGSISFGVYVFHALGISVARRVFHAESHWAVFVAAAALSIGAGALGHALVDGWAERARARLFTSPLLAPSRAPPTLPAQV
jgi:peptidoglycan/LPS O-acetylase OafA/YrhL